MDPQVTWQTLLEAYQAHDWATLEEAANALLSWLSGGGFPPRLDQEDDAQRRLIAQICCHHALDRVPRSHWRRPHY
jgi:hypothetical protein